MVLTLTLYCTPDNRAIPSIVVSCLVSLPCIALRTIDCWIVKQAMFAYVNLESVHGTNQY